MIDFKIVCLAIGLLSTFSSCQSQELYEPLFKCTKKLDNSYGICTHINRVGERYEYDTRDMDLSMIDRVGANIIRTDFDRPVIQDMAKGTLIYKQFDSIVTSVQQHKKATLGIITMGYTPQNSEDWNKYVFETSKRYKKNRYWEIINEIDIVHHLVPDFKSAYYFSFLKEGYNAIKKTNPRAMVLFSGLSSITEVDIDHLLTKDCVPYFDIMNVHKYANNRVKPEDFIGFYKKLHHIMTNININKPVWVTETGASTYSNGGVSEKLQAIWLPRIFLISFACGIDKVFWYKSRSREIDKNDIEDHYGLWHKDYTPKPAFYTYEALTKLCPDKSTRPKLARFHNVYVASWKRPDRKKVWALWTSEKDETVSLKIKGRYTMYNDQGEEINNRTSLETRITPSVLYIVGAKELLFE